MGKCPHNYVVSASACIYPIQLYQMLLLLNKAFNTQTLTLVECVGIVWFIQPRWLCTRRHIEMHMWNIWCAMGAPCHHSSRKKTLLKTVNGDEHALALCMYWIIFDTTEHPWHTPTFSIIIQSFITLFQSFSTFIIFHSAHNLIPDPQLCQQSLLDHIQLILTLFGYFWHHSNALLPS